MIDFQIIPEASADVLTLMKSVNRVVINPIIFFLFAAAMVYFLYGLMKYLTSPDNEEVRKTSKSHMIWGVVGLFVMVAVFGIMRLILNTVGENKVKIQSNGDYEIVKNNATDANGNLIDSDSYELAGGQEEYNVDQSGFTDPDKQNSTEIDATTAQNDVSSANYSTEGNPQTSPFKKIYIPNPKCWRDQVYSADTSEYRALRALRTDARAKMLVDTGLSDSQVAPGLPFAFESKTLFDSKSGMYYVWWDARAPINGGSKADCNLALKQLPPYQDRSAKANLLIGDEYYSDNVYYRATDSGVSVDLAEAVSIATDNAIIQLARKKELLDIAPVVAKAVLVDSACYPLDKKTKMYDCWVSMEIKIK